MSRRDEEVSTFRALTEWHLKSPPKLCHVYIVASHPLGDGKPDGDCFKCGRPLRDHPKEVSSLVPSAQAFAIDRRMLREQRLP